jgi:serine/threonine protein kinase
METARLQQLFLEESRNVSLSKTIVLEGIAEDGIFYLKDMDTGENLELEVVQLRELGNIERIVEVFRTVFFVLLQEKEGKCLYPYRFPCYRDFFLINGMEKASIGMIYKKVEGETLERWGDIARKEKNFMDTLISIGYSVLVSLFILHQHGIYHRNISPTCIYYAPTKKEWRKRVFLKDFGWSCNETMGRCEGTFQEDVQLLGEALVSVAREGGGKFFSVLINLPSSFLNTKDVIQYYEFHYSHMIEGELMDEYYSLPEK